MSSSRALRAGFSLIELLVVISIVTIMATLLLSAVQGGREAARGVSCADHQRQIGLGLAMHHDTHGAFPSNGGWDGRQTIAARDGSRVEVFTRTNAEGRIDRWGVGDPGLPPQLQTGGWAYAILPYVEQGNLYNQLNYEVALTIYHCPSRRAPAAIVPRDDDNASYSGGGWAWGAIDFAVNGRLIKNRPGSHHPLDPRPAGPPDPRRDLATIAAIRDGTSTTILTGEKAMDPAVHSPGGWFWDEPFLLGGSYATARRGFEVLPGRLGIPHQDNWGSDHPTTAHFGFADGSVRPIRHSTSSTLMKALLTPGGAEIVPAF